MQMARDANIWQAVAPCTTVVEALSYSRLIMTPSGTRASALAGVE